MIPEYERSKIATLTSTFSQNDVPVDPTSLLVTIYCKGTIKIEAASPTNVTVGHFYKEISIGSDWDLDYYAAVWTGVIAGVAFKKAETFKVIDSIVETDVSAPSTAYCTVNDVLKELVGIDYTTIDDYVNLLNTRILQMEFRLDNKVHRSFKTATTTEYVNGSGTRQLVLPHKPVTALFSLAIRVTQGTDWWTPANIAFINTTDHRGLVVRTPSSDAEVKAASLLVDCVNGILTIPRTLAYQETVGYPFWDYTFLALEANIKVTYTHGYAAADVPLDIRLLCAKMTAQDFLQVYGDLLSGGGSSVNIDGQGRSFGGIPFAGRLEMLQKDINEIVDNYRVIGVN